MTAHPRWLLLCPDMSLDHCGQLRGQLRKIRDVHKGIAIDPFDVLLIFADCRRYKQDSLATVFLLDAAKILFRCAAIIPTVRRLTV